MSVKPEIRRAAAKLVRPAITSCAALALLALAGCGATGSASAPGNNPSPQAAAATGPQQVSLSEWKLEVPSTIKAGQVVFTIKNAGTIEHELLVFKSDLDVKNYPLGDGGNINEDAATITKLSDGENLVAGTTQQRTVDLTKPGTYLFVCNLPSHFGQGMSQVVTVVP